MSSSFQIRRSVGCACVAVLIAVAGSNSAQPPVSEGFLHGMVSAAQSLSERAQELHRAERKESADELFDQALNILVDADRRSLELRGQLEDPRALIAIFDHVYNRFWEARAAVDPAVERQQRRIEAETTETYGEEPYQPGQVRAMVTYLARHKQQFLENSFRRSLRYIPMIEAEFEAQGIPKALAYMALIESGFRPDPTSHAGAQGMWQFMPATARQYGLTVGGGVDERNDPVKATRAAARYLLALRRRFDNWPLAVAAYNCGEGRVERSLKKHGVKTFWELSDVGGLPRETLQYVPSIAAATIISRAPRDYGIDYP